MPVITPQNPRQVAQAITLKDVQDAMARVKGRITNTPVFTSTHMNTVTGFDLIFKHEGMNKTGSFKCRGASNALAMLTDEQAAKGVVTHSSGNFAQALAWASQHARNEPINAYVCMPDNAPLSKREAAAGYNGIISICPSTIEGREAAAEKVRQETGAEFIHAAHDTRVMAGQGTMALEILEAHPDIQAIVVPVGGGGLISGVAVAIKGMNSNIKVIGAEPEITDEAARSLQLGSLQKNTDYSDTVADGLRVAIGDKTFSCINNCVDAIVTVPEQDIIDACFTVFHRMKVVIEPSAGVGVAAVLKQNDAIRVKLGLERDAKVAVILCGSNIDMMNKPLPWLK
ncbi:hypothetical protein SARC_04144 [Sphaeroforma arctica JP610]|uniref:Tryptophan synthase beta chain-like PALP domain-containing protein n=1 Tax=Sphaeroforma arctica JP610 TaxID=667725 RepID=A0A0L0G428_9EUKA|nr:hypothetical protein SARC_04144 [Sphaeroforma arctica JP610]KNC83609.1 hypothetical protein SARC_04144 [Sphaeroforma arctica JP610]|eukprot:XP_014157511.1 hypothetical protein SARC_04144 [Sphaeroforma arctica JP610]